jgi:putative membrane protein
MAELTPGVTACGGMMFGAAVWVVADESVVPALGLSKPPTEYPLSVHVYSLASHLVYGLTAEITRRVVRHLI